MMNLKIQSKHKTLWLIDTSIFCEILKVPDMDSKHTEVIEQMNKEIEKGSSFFLPYSTIIETGNHIAHAKRGDRFKTAKRYIKAITAAIDGQAPWVLLQIPSVQDMQQWLVRFPADYAVKTIGAGDASIIQDYHKLCEMHPMKNVAIWSLDDDLKGYQRNGRLF
jgi:hypothetical protein